MLTPIGSAHQTRYHSHARQSGGRATHQVSIEERRVDQIRLAGPDQLGGLAHPGHPIGAPEHIDGGARRTHLLGQARPFMEDDDSEIQAMLDQMRCQISQRALSAARGEAVNQMDRAWATVNLPLRDPGPGPSGRRKWPLGAAVQRQPGAAHGVPTK